MRRNLVMLFLAALLADPHLVKAGGKDVTDRARVKVIAGKWVSTTNKALEFTEDVAFTQDSGGISLTFFRVEGFGDGASYSIIGNNSQAVLFLKFEGEEGVRKLGLEIKTEDHFITTGETVAEWHRRHEDLDLTDYETLRKLSGMWEVSDIDEEYNDLEFTTTIDRELNLDGPYKVKLYNLKSFELGGRLPLKSYSVIQYPDGARTLVLSAGGDVRYFAKFKLEDNVLFLDGERRFAMRSVGTSVQEVGREKGSLDVRVAHGEVLGLTVNDFVVRLEGDDATDFLRREDSSGNALMQSGYAHFGLLPQGKYRLTITGHFRKGDERVPFSMGADYVFRGGTAVCEANVSNGTFRCI